VTSRPAVFIDRDGTLTEEVGYVNHPSRLRLLPRAGEAIRRLNAAGLAAVVVTNQSGIARGLLTRDDVRRVNARVDELFGGFDVWAVCPHAEGDGCACRKPAPGMVLDAAARLGVPASEVAVVGDIGADVEAAQAAGAGSILVPTPDTRPEEIAAAPVVVEDLGAAVDLVLARAADR
jgi:histidinol-phosphate phosphatase family protein